MKAYKQAHGEHYTHEVLPFAEIILVRVFRGQHTSWSRRRKTLAQERRRVHQRCVGLVEVRRGTNTSFSHLEVACFGVQLDDWNRHDDTVLYFSVT